MSAQSWAGRVLAAVKPMISWTLQTLRELHGNLVLFLSPGPPPSASSVIYLTRHCEEMSEGFAKGKELRGGGVYYHVLTPFY